MTRFWHWFDRMLDLMGGLAAVLLAVVTLVITANILIRGFNLGSLPWTDEVVKYSLLAVTFIAAPWVLRKSAHVRVDIVVENMPPGLQRHADLLANVIGLVVCAFIFYYGLKSTIELYDSGTKIYEVLTVKEWWLFAPVPVSSGLMLIEFARRIVQGRSSRDSDEKPGGEASF
jgi:TRAP-type C4-dicarboxylate transport system permease small subunit